jgi:hypothetical protein
LSGIPNVGISVFFLSFPSTFSRWSLIVITWHLLLFERHYTEQPHLPTYTLDLGKPTTVLNKPTSFSSIHSLLTGGLICVMDMGTCKTIDLKKYFIIVHDENLSNVRFVTKYLKIFKYEICNKIFEIKYILRKHYKIVHDENFSNVIFVTKYLKLSKCEICNKIFEIKHKLKKHYKIVHDENFSNVGLVTKHLKLFKCEICSKIFERKYELRKHIKIVRDENFSNVRLVKKYLKLFKCEICNKIFETNMN